MRKIAQFVVIQILQAYKWAISPMFPPACRYVPTCSEYAMEAVERYGAVRGSWLALVRLLRCHPFVKGGYDPVVRTSPTEDEPANVTHCHRAI
jgi:putative membrane protein insertion efficiency factor